MKFNCARWGNNDCYFGPFTFATDNRYKPFAIELSSSNDEDESCNLRISGFGYTLISVLPPIIKPWRNWINTSKYKWSDNLAGGFWDIHRKTYGLTIDDGYVHLHYGPQTGDSATEKSKCWRIPWMHWRHVRTSLYDTTGSHFWTEPLMVKGQKWDWELMQMKRETCPSVEFAFTDYDGERITAIIRIVEREWLFGIGYFKWLSFFSKPRISRSLNIDFSKETGKKKGS